MELCIRKLELKRERSINQQVSHARSRYKRNQVNLLGYRYVIVIVDSSCFETPGRIGFHQCGRLIIGFTQTINPRYSNQ